MDTKCESPLGVAVESALGVRSCEVGTAVYVLTVKSSASELFFYRLNPDDGSIVFKVNLWDEVTDPAFKNTFPWARIVVSASGSFVYINRGIRLTKVKTGITTPLDERIVWDVLASGGNSDLALPPDGDPRWGEARISAIDGSTVWGAVPSKWISVGFDNQLHTSFTGVGSGIGLPIRQLDEDGNLDWTHTLPPATSSLSVEGVGTTGSGRVWVGYTAVIVVGGGTEDRYRERMIDELGVLFTAFEVGEPPSIRGSTDFLVSNLLKTRASWIFTTTVPTQRRIKRLTDANAEVDNTDLTVAQLPTLAIVRGNTGTYLKRPGDFVRKTTDILTTDIWSTAIDSSLDSGFSVWIGVKD